MKKIIYCISLLFIANSNAQVIDSITIQKKELLSYKSFIVPTTLIISGSLLINSGENKNIQTSIQNSLNNNFRTKIDDVIQYAPIAQIYAGHLLGLKPKNNIKQQTINVAVASLITTGLVYGLKKSILETRPDLSDNKSFPSGHTAIAFTNASILFYEYKDSNIWYASSGYFFATATGMLRVANNQHFTSDVLAGAGIGMSIGLLVSYWNPLQSLSIGKNKKTQAVLYPQIGQSYGMGIIIRD